MHLMELDQHNKFEAAPQVYEHYKRTREFYLRLAQRVLRDEKELREIDRVDFVALFIRKFDKDVYGLDGKGMSPDEICQLFARAVVGHENGESDDDAN
jgi:hypothetical protein